MFAPFSSKPAIGVGFIILSFSLLFLVDVAARSGIVGPDRSQILLNGTENHMITLSEAEQLITNHRIMSEPGSVQSEMFGREAIERILNQSECAGLRIYYAKQNDLASVLVLMGVDRFGGDLRYGEIVEHGFPCPPFCDTVNVAIP